MTREWTLHYLAPTKMATGMFRWGMDGSKDITFEFLFRCHGKSPQSHR